MSKRSQGKTRLISVSIEEMYGGSYEGYDAILDQSLNPRSPELLYEKFAAFGPTSATVVLDLGCRDAAQACELHRRFGCHVEGIDLVTANVEAARNHIQKEGLAAAVQVTQGDIHALPYPDNTFEFIWCRDVLGHMRDLARAFAEAARVLRPGGKMLIFELFATERLSDEEASHLWSSLAVNPENASRDHFDEALAAAGFSIIEADVIGSEWREFGEENESKRTSKQLLRIARLIRQRDRYIAAFGAKDYAVELADAQYGVYQMLGKLSAVIYSLQNRGR